MTESNGPSKGMIFRAMWNNMLPVIRNQGGEIFGKITEGVAKNVTSEEVARKAGDVVNNTFKVGVTVSANVRDFTVVAKESRRRMGELLDDVEPYLVDEFGKSSRGKLMRSGNEVISHERDRLIGQTKYGIFKAASGLTDKLPELYRFMSEKREAVESGAITEAMAENDVRAKLDESLGKVASSSVFDEQNFKLLSAAVYTGAPAIQEYIEAEGVSRFGQVSAFGMIKGLADQAKSGDGRIGYVMHPQTQEHMTLQEYVVEVFRQHQEDVGGAPLNDRFRFMPELEQAAKRIAEEIEENLLDPMALVSLVGGRKVLDDNLRVADIDTLNEEITHVWRVLEKTQQVDSKEFIAETAFATKEDFRAILDELPGEEKAFFASLFPDAVLKEMGGLKEAEIDRLKEEGCKEFVEHMTRAIETLGTLGEKEMQRYGLTAKEGQLMRELSDAIDEMGADVVIKGLQGKAREEVTEAVRNGRGYWQERVKAGAGRGKDAEERGASEPESVTEGVASEAETAPEVDESFTARVSRKEAAEERGR